MVSAGGTCDPHFSLSSSFQTSSNIPQDSYPHKSQARKDDFFFKGWMWGWQAARHSGMNMKFRVTSEF